MVFQMLFSSHVKYLSLSRVQSGTGWRHTGNRFRRTVNKKTDQHLRVGLFRTQLNPNSTSVPAAIAVQKRGRRQTVLFPFYSRISTRDVLTRKQH
jgi:hypothetical protein